jgi:hypothetical protein
MKTKEIGLFCFAIMPFVAGCASTPTALSPVGPLPGNRVAAAKDSQGYLQVFSATEKSLPVASDDPYTFNLHSGYDINDDSGKAVRFVPNHASSMDEWPDQVTLPAGNYNIVAESTWCGQVTVPVVIQKGKTTVVHLDDNWWPPSNTPANQLVCLPNGEAVGWSGLFSKSAD